MALEQLAAPPIDEVICGVVHQPIADLDPITTGMYWRERRTDYPLRQLHPALAEESTTLILSGAPPIRSWFISKDEAFVVQIQRNRFLMNWRKRRDDQRYPRFSDHGGEKGILSRFLLEFEQFSKFCSTEFKETPSVTGIEVAKVDLFHESVHWSSFSDLAVMLPWLKEFAAFSVTDSPSVSCRYQE